MTDGTFFDSDGTLISFSNEIWSRVSENLDGIITANNIYISVYQDRHLWQTRLRQKFEINVSSASSPLISDNSSSESSVTDVGSEDVEKSKHFSFDISYEDYLKIKPTEVVYGKKTKKKKLYSVETRCLDQCHK